MDAKQQPVPRKNRNPQVQRVLKPYLIFFFIKGIDLIHESMKEVPLYFKIYLYLARTINFIQRIAGVIVFLVALAKNTRDIGTVSLLTGVMVAIVNSLVGLAVFYFKGPLVMKMLNQLDDIITDIIDHDALFHKKVVLFQRCYLVFLFGVFIIIGHAALQNNSSPEFDFWFSNNGSSCHHDARPPYFMFLYAFTEVGEIISHLIIIGFLATMTFYVHDLFKCLRQKCSNGIRELNERLSSSSPRLIRTVNAITVWDTKRSIGPPNQRGIHGSKHPVWDLLRRHQALSELVVLMDDTFREAAFIWSFSEMTTLIFMIRAMNIGGDNSEHFLTLSGGVAIFTAMFVIKSIQSGSINDQVG